MVSSKNITTAQLRQVLELREQIESLQARLAEMSGGTTSGTSTKGKARTVKRKRRTMSPEARAKIAAAQKARWAKKKLAKS